jgi:hypothetical protein
MDFYLNVGFIQSDLRLLGTFGDTICALTGRDLHVG